MMDRLLVAVIVVLTLFTAAIMALVARSEVAAHRVTVEPLRAQALSPGQWRRLTAGARLISDQARTAAEQRITIVAFSDFECPACRRFSRIVTASKTRYGGRIAWMYRDYPLNAIHPEAMIAARAGVCADAAKTFRPFYEAVFNSQDSLAQVHWPELARGAGVRDTVRFASCLASAASAREVAHDMALGDSIGVSATPTVVINGLRLSRPPTTVELDSILITLR